MVERDSVVLVDGEGSPLGTARKRAAHERPGQRHLAFSVFVLGPGGRLLIQQRARSKYHFPGIWANTCCSHPAPGEDVIASAERRLEEEVGMRLRDGLQAVGRFEYRAVDPVSGLVEHELDHVLVGTATADYLAISIDADEIEETRWVEVGEVRGAGPSTGFAPWFAPALEIALRARLD
jgi:isopentenyl-diphosphate delta-isomerase